MALTNQHLMLIQVTIAIFASITICRIILLIILTIINAITEANADQKASQHKQQRTRTNMNNAAFGVVGL